MSALTDLNNTVPTQAAVGYFVDQKKGEVNELKLVILSCIRQNRWLNHNVFNVAVEKSECRKRCTTKKRNYQKSYCVYDSRHRCFSVVHGHDNGKVALMIYHFHSLYVSTCRP